MKYIHFSRFKNLIFEKRGFLILWLFLSCSILSMGQPLNNGAWLSWDREVGCRTYDYDPNPKYNGYLEDIQNAPCLGVCEWGNMIFYMRGNNINSVIWEISGGEIVQERANQIQVSWGHRGAAALSFKVIFDNGSFTQGSMCIEVIAAPIAAFKLHLPPEANEEVVCLNTPIVIKNLSDSNGGTQIVSYEWDFGDGSISYERNPQHNYTRPGSYTISLKVTNECNCSSYYKTDIKVDRLIATTISCPTVSCEDSVQTYTVESECDGKWFVEGGEIISENNTEIKVIWNDVDDEGFGYVSYMSHCGCKNWTTVQIPVVKSIGTISGNPVACLNKLQRFSMPQWPTTDFQWELISLSSGRSTLIPTDQRNEIILKPLEIGTYLLVCNYTNTMLRCGGRAEFELEVIAVPEISGPTAFCQFAKDIYYESNLNIPLLWEVKRGNISVLKQFSPSFFWESPTAGFYTITATNQDYCTSDPLVVEVTGLPDISEVVLIGEKMICPNFAYVYKIDDDEEGFTYEWEVQHGRVHGSRFGNEVTITFDEGESIQRVIRVRKFSLNALGCTSGFKSFEILNMNPTATFTNLENTVLFCPSTHSNFNVDFDLDFEPEHIYWEAFPRNFANIIQGQGTKNVKVSWNEISNSPSGYLRLTVRKCNTEYVFNHPITLFQNPNFTRASFNPTDICVYQSFTLTLISDSNLTGGRIRWNLNNGSPPTPASSISGTTITSPPLEFKEEMYDDIDRVITATIINPNGCQTEIEVNFRVRLHPRPVIMVTPNSNIFVCPENGYSVTLYATHQLDIPDENMEWYRYGESDILGYGPNYTVAGNRYHSEAGSYYVKMTSRFGCTKKSDLVHIIENCNASCNGLNQTVTTSFSQSCNSFPFTGTYTGNPEKVSWRSSFYLKTEPGYTTTNATFTTRTPGLHIVQYLVDYLFNGNICRINISKSFFKPYEADFKYSMACVSDNNTRDVTIIDYSNYADRSNVTYTFSRDGLPPAYVGPNSEYTFRNLAPGTYRFKIQLSNGTAYKCSKEKDVVVKGRPNAQFRVNYDPNCIENPILLEPLVYDPEYEYKWVFNYTALKIPYAAINLPEGNSDWTNIIKLVVTDRYGCWLSSEQGPIMVNKALFPDSKAIPVVSSFCEGGSARLSVQAPTIEQVVAYQWMKGVNRIPNATNSTLGVNETGNYWPVLFDANGCGYYGARSAVVIAKKPPLVILNPPTKTCSGSPTKISATIADPLVSRQWIRNNTVIHPWSTNTPLELQENLAVGNYVYVLNVRDPQDPACVESSRIEFEITEPPQLPNIQIDIVRCTPYEVKLTAQGPAEYTYVWSNGMSGQSIMVREGGPYRVRVIAQNGCEVTQSIQVPKHNDTYMWVIPTGCIEVCPTKDDDWFTILGPLGFFSKHYWIRNQEAIQGGNYIPVNPLIVNEEGAYNLLIDQGSCDSFSKELEVKKSHEDCGSCKIDVRNEGKFTWQKDSYLSIFFDLFIANYMAEQVQISFENPEREGVFVPMNTSLRPYEQRTLVGVEFIPFDPNYNGSRTTIKLVVRINGKVVCDYYTSTLDIRADYRGASVVPSPAVLASVQLTPNPTSGETVLYYETTLTTPDADVLVELFDLLGKQHWSGSAKTPKGSVLIPAERLVSGKYLVVLYVNGRKTYQHLLIKN